MAKAAKKHTPKTLDDAARFLIEERGYKKNPALCWEILEQIWAKQITLERHRKKYDLNGNPQEDGTEVVNPAVCRNLDFDRHGHIRLVPEWDGERYTIVEPCDFRIIWPPPALQAAVDTKTWITAEAIRLKKEKKIPPKARLRKTDFAKLLEECMVEAKKTNKLLRLVGWRHIKNKLDDWGLWPVQSIKIS